MGNLASVETFASREETVVERSCRGISAGSWATPPARYAKSPRDPRQGGVLAR